MTADRVDACVTVIGLEVHVQLATQTKLFCGCRTTFGAPPNTQTCPVCLGLPGALPVMNAHALDLALVTGLALHCEIPPITKWDRKQYYYPDLPKGYQISQYDQPLAARGYLEIEGPKGAFPRKRIGILRAHLEEDAGKSMHDEIAGAEDSRIDLNRTGTPLLEIVTQPDLRSPLEARVFLDELKLLLSYLAVSDCNMQEGSLRVDANVNLHLTVGDESIATPIVEIKNLNSFRGVERAIQYEADRQLAEWRTDGHRMGSVPKRTRGWDDQKEVTTPLRGKEESSDYRYFPDPDLVPVRMTEDLLARARSRLTDLPSALRETLSREYQLSEYDADVLVNQGRALVTYFRRLADQSGDFKQASNWVQRDILRYLKEQMCGIEAFPVPAEELARLIVATRDGSLDTARARDLFQEMLAKKVSFESAIQSLGIVALDASAIEQLCRELLRRNPRIVADVRAGNEKALGAVIGQARKENPNANPNDVRSTCLRLIAEMV